MPESQVPRVGLVPLAPGQTVDFEGLAQEFPHLRVIQPGVTRTGYTCRVEGCGGEVVNLHFNIRPPDPDKTTYVHTRCVCAKCGCAAQY